MKHSSPHTYHPAFPNQEQPLPPPPDLIDGEEHYEVEKVLDSRERKVRGKSWRAMALGHGLLCQMEGYGPESNSWVREDSMEADELIDKYLAKHIGMVSNGKEDWEFYTDPRTGRKLKNYEELWDLFDIFGGHDDPSTDTKSPFKPTSIP